MGYFRGACQSASERIGRALTQSVQSPIALSILLFLCGFISFPVSAQPAHSSWDDLDSPESEVYGSERARRYSGLSGVYEIENWPEHRSKTIVGLYRDTDYPRSTSARFLPFYYHLASKVDNRDRMVVFPFYYGVTDGGETLHLTPISLLDDSSDSYFHLYGWLFLRQGSKDSGTKWNSTALLPLFFYGNSPSEKGSYLALAPLFYHSTESSNHESTWITPVLYSSSDDTSNFSVSPLHFYASSDGKTSEGKPDPTFFWGIPILPFLSYNVRDSGVTHRNILTLIDFEYSDSKVNRFWFIPFFFLNQSEDDGYLYTPVYLRSRSSKTETTTVIPPLYYNHDDKGTGHSNYALLFDHDYDEKGNWTRNWILPFYMRGDGYRHVLPFYFSFFSYEEDEKSRVAAETESYRFGPGYYFHSSKSNNQRDSLIGNVWWSHAENIYAYKKSGEAIVSNDDSLHVFPLWYSWKSRGEKFQSNSTYINPFFVLSNDLGGYTQDLNYYNTFWAPIIPLFYFHGNSESGRHYYTTLFDWRTSPLRELTQFWAIPFYFWKKGPEGYLVIPPFFIRPGAEKAESGISFSALHYHSWTTESDFLWLGLYYRDINPIEQYEHIVPVYYSWHTQQSDGRIFFPAWLDYADRTKNYHINIAGISKTKQAGVVGATIGLHQGRLYVDTEFSWLYEAFSFAARLSVPDFRTKEKMAEEPSLKEMEKIKIQDVSELFDSKKPEKKEEAVRLTRTLTTNRENSNYYWGFNVLYGVLGYAHSDSKRHFRLLPFSWLTWDAESDDRVYVVPGAFLSYKSENLEYFALFPAFLPLYGKQQQGESYIKAYGVIAYLREHDQEKKSDEWSFLWPLSNFYESPSGSSSRILPVYWSKTEKSAEVTSKRVVSLAFYKSSTTAPDDSKSLLFAPIIPIFLSSNVEYRGSTNWELYSLPLIYYNKRTWPGEKPTDKPNEESTLFAMGYYSTSNGSNSEWSFLLGLVGYSSYKETKTSELKMFYGLFSLRSNDSEGSSRFLPFYYYSRDSYDSTLFLSVPLFYRNWTKTHTHSNLMLLADWESNSPNVEEGKQSAPQTLTRFWLMPVFAWGAGNDGYLYVLPVYVGKSSTIKETSFHVLPLFYSWFGENEWMVFAAGLYLRSTPDYGRLNFLYMIDHTRNGKSWEWEFLLGSVHASSTSYEGSDATFRTSLLYKTLFSYSSSSKDYEMNALLYLTGVERYGQNFHSRVLPAWWYDSSPTKTRFITPLWWYEGSDTETSLLTPLWYYSKDSQNSGFYSIPWVSSGAIDGSDKFQLAMLGSLWYRNYSASERSDRELVLLGILYDESIRGNGVTSRGSLWGWLWNYETEGKDYYKFSVLKFIYGQTLLDGEVKHRILFFTF